MENKRRTEIKQQSIFDYKSLIKALDDAGVKRIHAYTIWRSVVQKNIKDISEIKDIPKAAYKVINEQFSILNIQLVNSQTSKDGNTTKIIFRLPDFHEIEAVIMRYGDDRVNENTNMSNRNNSSYNNNNNKQEKITPKYKRISICVSSQIGCRMGCMFCATGFMGLRGSLLSGEILQQLYYIRNILKEPVRNVVFMGMGEPLENYDEVIDAIRLMVDPRLFSLSSGHILVSTVGIPSNIINLADDLPGVGLCLSLHAPNQSLRERIIPIARLYKVSDLMRSLDIFIFKTIINKCYRNLLDDRNKDLIKDNMNYDDILISNKLLYGHKMIIIEYTMLKDVNDSEEHAIELANLLKYTPISKNIFEELIDNRDDSVKMNINKKPFNNYMTDNRIINKNLKNQIASTIFKELSKDFKRTNFAIVNLIPYNKTNTSTRFSTPSKETITKFAKALIDLNIFVTVRRKMGDGIFGACGQLALKQVKNYNIEDVNQQLGGVSDDENNSDEDFIDDELFMNSSEVEDSEFEAIEKPVNNSDNSARTVNMRTNSLFTIQTKFNNNFKISNIFSVIFSSYYNICKSFILNNKTSILLFIGSGFYIHYFLRKNKRPF
ncbi:radical SAM domain-containing [Cryptosporidium sp. chipmunk genotype I]|uniref:radical SAM domain-containing n=1 Tax=Cryptosporidium sp. chipmunk genotype I TaxID=1280935 RepID=UPI00351A26E0|nr:radical SAM domain-containing [Cryptosporidium sp. chipmunk genotype I]